jgi:hypothetical protein
LLRGIVGVGIITSIPDVFDFAISNIIAAVILGKPTFSNMARSSCPSTHSRTCVLGNPSST